MEIEKVRNAHKREWLALVILEEQDGRPVDVELLFHSPERETVWEKIEGDPRPIYVTYAGPILEEGQAFAF